MPYKSSSKIKFYILNILTSVSDTMFCYMDMEVQLKSSLSIWCKNNEFPVIKKKISCMDRPF